VNKERMGKFEGGEERLKKSFASPFLNLIRRKCIYKLYYKSLFIL
jgi:hypothetical protein